MRPVVGELRPLQQGVDQPGPLVGPGVGEEVRASRPASAAGRAGRGRRGAGSRCRRTAPTGCMRSFLQPGEDVLVDVVVLRAAAVQRKPGRAGTNASWAVACCVEVADDDGRLARLGRCARRRRATRRSSGWSTRRRPGRRRPSCGRRRTGAWTRTRIASGGSTGYARRASPPAASGPGRCRGRRACRSAIQRCSRRYSAAAGGEAQPALVRHARRSP